MKNEETIYTEYSIRPFGQTSPEKVISATSAEAAAVTFVATEFGQIEEEIMCVVSYNDWMRTEYAIVHPEEIAVWLNAMSDLTPKG